jgi:pyruvate kinase
MTGSLPESRLLRRTKIVATLGPASTAEPVLRKLIDAGVDVVRLNFSHGTRQDHGHTIRTLRRLAAEAQVPVAVLQDLQGPKIRLGTLAHPIRLQDGSHVILTTRRVTGTPQRIPIPFPRLTRVVRRGSRILLRDGTVELEVLSRTLTELRCRVVRGGTVDTHQGVNLPGVRLTGPTLTAKDVADLRFGVRAGVDYVALSFVRRPSDLRHARRLLRRMGVSVPLVAKLETAEAVAHLDAIIAEADAVMVARGDLGVELAIEQIPLLQKRIIHRANARGIPVITATQMLESMVSQRRPTRAETSDVANAILDGTDAVMLSAETAAGRYPVEAVETMDRIARAVEDGASPRPSRPRPRYRGALSALGAAAQALVEDLRVALVVVLTTTGRTARFLSQRRLPVPILACTEEEGVARRLRLCWGVHSLVLPFRRPTEAMVRFLDSELVRRGLARPGDILLVVGSIPIIARGRTNFLQVHRIPGRSGKNSQGPIVGPQRAGL